MFRTAAKKTEGRKLPRMEALKEEELDEVLGGMSAALADQINAMRHGEVLLSRR